MEITTSSLAVSLSSSIPRPTPVLNLPFCSSSSFCCGPTLLKNARTRSIALRLSTPSKQQPRRKAFSCNALFGLGVPELVVIAGVTALVFGPKQLPEVGRSIGKTVKSFQQAAKEFESELKKEPDSTGEGPPEKPIAVSEQKQDIEVSSSKESV